MRTTAGTATLVRFVLRRDRLRLPLWLIGIVLLVVVSAASVAGLYTTQAEIEAYVRLTGDNPAVVAVAGPGYGFDDPNLGVVMVNETALSAAVAMALMSIFLVNRHTRAEEESGRSELVRSTVVGRHAPIAAALAVVVGANVVLAVVLAASLVSLGYGVTGTVALAAGLAGVGLVFAGLTAVWAQVTGSGRAVLGASSATLGLAFALRAAGDVGDGTLSWLSPIGWAQAARPFADERWWTLGLLAVTAGLLCGSAVVLEARRDLGGGLVPQRLGRSSAPSWSTTPLGLAVRLQRGLVAGWASGLFFLGLIFGSVARDVDQLVADNPEMADVFAGVGGSLTDSFLAASVSMLAMIGAGFGISSALRLRSEESAGRAEPILATATARRVWAGSHLAVAAVGTVVVLAAAGLGTGVAYAAAIGDAAQVPRLLGASLVQVPGVLVLVGVAVALFGLLPRFSGVAWGVLAGVLVVGFLGELLRLPGWLRDLSPLEHVPSVPAVPLTLVPLAVLTVVAAALAAAGLVGFRTRDVG